MEPRNDNYFVAMDGGYWANLRYILDSVSFDDTGLELRVCPEVLAFMDYMASNLNMDQILAFDKIQQKERALAKCKLRQAYIRKVNPPKEGQKPVDIGVFDLLDPTKLKLLCDSMSGCADNVKIKSAKAVCFIFVD